MTPLFATEENEMDAYIVFYILGSATCLFALLVLKLKSGREETADQEKVIRTFLRDAWKMDDAAVERWLDEPEHAFDGATPRSMFACNGGAKVMQHVFRLWVAGKRS